MAGHGFVHGVVQDFRSQMVQSAFVRAADVHAGAAANGLQAFQNLDVLSRIIAIGCRGGFFRGLGSGWGLRGRGFGRRLNRLLFVFGVLK